ncbi:prepilin-type N-terminal cleavage/methylation domain-containing protein [Candidatus Parcubacteria bacterium]|nr:MAG: prepilin-type N-terminal cleavage/methylation domain-containing protein [Candidatus Parcubacteria bacterium]
MENKKRKGFTLIELLIVIGIIAILAAIVYVAVDPARRLAEARDATRWSEVNSVLNAVLKYTVDNRGTLPTNLAGATDDLYYVLGTAASGCNTGCTARTTQGVCLDLTADLVDEYLSEIPQDPSLADATPPYANTDYYIMKSANGRITVGACDPERAAAISVTR